MEMICYRRLLRVSYKDHTSNETIREIITQHIGPHKDLLSTVKERKLKWFGHVTRRKSIANTIMHGSVRGSRPPGRPKKTWLQNIKEWTGTTQKWPTTGTYGERIPDPRLSNLRPDDR